jgi:hypothetical protein
MIDPTVGADYVDALITARRGRNILVTIILLILMLQVVLFFLARYKIDLDDPGWTRSMVLLKYAMDLIDFVGLIVPIVLGVVLFLIAMIMLVGRLIGVAHGVAAFLWSVVLAALLFPWQAFLVNETFTSTEFKIPGVLYTWGELVARARAVPNSPLLYWARFVGWPVVAMILTVVVLMLSRRGLGMALGENAIPEPIRPEEPPAPHPHL